MKSKTAFTRKDVIVVLGCVVFLLMTLGAIGSRGRRRAKEAACLSNLRRMGSAFSMFATDNDGYFMRGYIGLETEPEDLWMEALRPYYRNPDLRCCPEAVLPMSEGGFEWNFTFAAWGVFDDDMPSMLPYVAGDYGSYGMNGWVCNPPAGAGYPYGDDRNWRTVNVAGADKVPLLLGGQWLDGWPGQWDAPPAYEGQWNLFEPMVDFCLNRHRGFVNGVFLDLSARRIGLKELWTLKWHREYNTCGPWTTCGGMQPSYWPVWMRDFEDY
ncbi:MAG: hypothetical protein JSW23_08120 [Planctomycetota bacterium]|nr:MAG: hypothetical protein JSW23_08120 [Planctomycetota bacterium]